jgi:hypothetical protein
VLGGEPTEVIITSVGQSHGHVYYESDVNSAPMSSIRRRGSQAVQSATLHVVGYSTDYGLARYDVGLEEEVGGDT